MSCMLGTCFAHIAIHDIESFLWVLDYSIIKFLGLEEPPKKMNLVLRKVFLVFVDNFDF